MDKFEEWYESDKEVDFYSRKGLAKAAWQHQQAKVDELQKINDDLANGQCSLYKRYVDLQKRVDAALEEMEQQSLYLFEGHDGYKDPVGICQSQGIEVAKKILEQALKGREA